MSVAPRLFGLILAAGASLRMGCDKAMLPWPPFASLLQAQMAALAPLTEAVIVVGGRNAATLEAAAPGAEMAINPEPERGQFSSLRVGLAAIRARQGEAAVITPVDCPPLGPATLLRLRTAFLGAMAEGRWGLAPERAGRHGHPLLASAELIEAFLQAPANSHARAVQQAHAERMQFEPVEEPWLGADLNTPEDYAALLPKSGACPSPVECRERLRERLDGQ